MRSHEFITEGKSHPCIVVDVQPEYCSYQGGAYEPVCWDIIEFINKQTGPVLMFVNAEDSGVSQDSIGSIQEYWEENGFNPDNWSRIQIVDKGYGYLRSWMDRGTNPAVIIRVIREMYQQKVSHSRELFGGENTPEYDEKMQALMGKEFRQFDLDDPITVNWTSIAQLKQFNGAYIMGGGRDECLREVELLMNAFNIKYKRIDSLVYG